MQNHLELKESKTLQNANFHITNKVVHIIVASFPCTNLQCYLINMRLRKVKTSNALSED